MRHTPALQEDLMFRRPFRSLIAIPTVALGISLIAAPTATAAPSEVADLAGVPQPPKSVDITWSPYAEFAVDHYDVTLNPGSRYKQVPAGATSTTFGDLSWSVSYTATVTAVASGGATSTPATLQLLGTRLVGDISPGIARRGGKVTVSGSLKWRSGEPIANAKVLVKRAFYPEPLRSSDFTTLGNVTTNRKGNFSLTTKAVRNAQYRVLYLGGPGPEPTVGGWDSNINLSVQAPITLRFSSNPVESGRSVRFSGKLKAPAKLVAGLGIRLQHRDGGSWKSVRSSAVKDDGTYAFKYTPGSRGNHVFRVVSGRNAYFVPSTSRAKVLTVS
jgi:hypothetical protein